MEMYVKPRRVGSRRLIIYNIIYYICDSVLVVFFFLILTFVEFFHPIKVEFSHMTCLGQWDISGDNPAEE